MIIFKLIDIAFNIIYAVGYITIILWAIAIVTRLMNKK